MSNIIERAIKTFVEAFCGVLIPEVVVILSNPTAYDFADWKVWALPIVCGALGTAISVTWNAIEKALEQKEEE